MNLNRRELNHKENRDTNKTEDTEKRDGAIKRMLKSGEKLLVAGVLSAGLVLGACGSAGPNSRNDATTEGTGGVLPGVEDTRTEDSASDLIDEDIIEDSEPGDVPVDVIEDSVEDGSDAVSDVPEDMEIDGDEDVATDSEEDVSTDTVDDEDAWDVTEDSTGDTVSDPDAVDMDTIDATEDSVADGSDVVGDTSDDVVSDLVDEGDVVGDGTGDVVSDTGLDIVGDLTDEDVEEEDSTVLVCMPYSDSVTDAWIAMDTIAFVGGVYIMYTGVHTETGKASYSIICGGTTARENVLVEEGATVTVDVLELGFRVEITADDVYGWGATTDITVSQLSTAVCSTSDSSTTAIIYKSGAAAVGGIDVRYDGPTTSGDGEYSILCSGAIVRSGIVVAIGSTHVEDVSEQSFSVELTPSTANTFNSRVYLEVDDY